MTVPQSFFIFGDLESFEEYWPGFFCRMSVNLYLSDSFLVISKGLWILRRKATEIKCHCHHITSGMSTYNLYDIPSVSYMTI